MATNAGEIEVTLTLKQGDFNKLLNQSQQNLQTFSQKASSFVSAHAIAITAALAGIEEFARRSVDAYNEQELATNKLVKALENQGRASDATLTHLNAMASALERQTSVADEVITSGQALLVTFGLQGDALDRATKAALDLSAGMGIDLDSAIRLVGKAFEGQTTMLQRYGIQVNNNLDPTKKFAAALGEIESRFGGSAAAQANSFAGQLKYLADSFNNLQEVVGRLIAGESGGIVKWLTDMVNRTGEALRVIADARAQFSSLGDFLRTFAVSILGTIILSVTTLIQKVFEMIGQIPILGQQYALMATGIKKVNTFLEDQIAKFQASRNAAALAAGTIHEAEAGKVRDFKNTSQQLIAITDQSSLYVKDKMAEEMKLRSENAATTKKSHEEFGKSFITTEAEMWDFATNTSNAFFQGMGDGLAKSIMEGKNFGDTMKNVFRDMAEAIISYIIQMIAKLLVLLALETATGTGPAGGAALGAIGGAFADGGVIAEPSIITGLHSGRRILAGESGPEIVTPAGGGNKTAAEMGGLPGSGGGGGLTINITGQFLEADANTWGRLIREKIVPQIQRYTMIAPTGSFNRRRGVA